MPWIKGNRMNRLILVFVGIVGIGGAGFFAMNAISDASYAAPDVANGKTAFLDYCLVCHGEKGRGDGPASHAMSVKPDDIHRELANPFGLKAELIDSVLNGDNGQNGTMPAFKGVLTEKEIVDIFGYIASINKQET